MSAFKSFNKDNFEDYIKKLSVKRKIKRIQLHHTYSPSYIHFNGKNHESLQKSMKNYHTNTNGWSDIAQHFTIFPDGIIMTGRSMDTNPAGIYGANAYAVCIECVGNFDIGGDVMNTAQKDAIVAVVRLLLDRFKLNAEDGVTYHAWWGGKGNPIGDYIKGKSIKTCPGTAFFGGNTYSAFKENLLPLIKNYKITKPLGEVISINDIVWELSNAKIVTDGTLWMKKCEEDVNIYWLCRKMANRIRGII